MQGLPYGFPKVMVSTAASGDTSAFVGIKDITMMFSVGDILGLNPVTRKMLANAAAATYGMACSRVTLDIAPGAKPLVGMTNLGVLTEGAMLALGYFPRRRVRGDRLPRGGLRRPRHGADDEGRPHRRRLRLRSRRDP